MKTTTNIAEYIARFSESNLINTFEEIVKADAPTAYFCDREVDILDIEMFFDEHCVAIGEEGIADLIANEYNKRADEKYTLCQIVLDFDGEETMIVAFDFSNVKFDVDYYINADWGLYSHEIEKIVEDAKAKIHE